MNGRKMSDASLIQHYHEHVFKNIKLSTQKILFQFDGQYLTSANVVYVSYLIVNLSNISVHLETKRNQRNFYSSYSSNLTYYLSLLSFSKNSNPQNNSIFCNHFPLNGIVEL